MDQYRRHPGWDFSKPIGRRRSPYYILPGKLITGRSNAPELTGGYLNSHGTRIDEGAFCDLRVTPVHDIENGCGQRLIDHKGWYTDDDGDFETCYGIIARLPGGRGFLAGHTLGAGMCATLDRSHVHDSERDAMYAADSMAEQCAEDERQHQREIDAARHVEDLREQICGARSDHTALIRAIWSTSNGDDATGARIRASVRDKVTALVEELRNVLRDYSPEIINKRLQEI